MRPTRFSQGCAAVLAALAMAACNGGGTTPAEPLDDLYVLTSLNGATNPMVLAEYTYPSGTRTVWLMQYDSVRITSDTQGHRRYEVLMLTAAHDGASVAPVSTPVSRAARIFRRGDKVIFDYDQTGSPVKSDTMFVRGRNLVKQGPFGVACTGNCTPPPQVEYVYEPR